MGTSIDKSIERLLSLPKDFKYKDLLKILNHFGFKEDTKGKTSGSRIKFSNINNDAVIILHKPHGSSNLKEYQLKQIIDILIKKGYIK